MDKRFWGILAAIAVIFVGIIVVNNHKKADTPNGNSGNGSLSNHVEGKDTTGVTLVEYGDFQCPACYSYFPIVKQVQEKYKDRISFQFRNFPLTQIHKNAFAGARAAEAAALQNKYWEMHDLLYQNQDPQGANGWVASNDPLNAYFVKFAQSLNLDVSKFKNDYASRQANSTINADMREGDRLGVNETPSFFINGKPVDKTKTLDDKRQPSVEGFSKLIDEAISNAKKN